MSAEPKRVEDLASLLSDHSFHTGYAAEQWFSCSCGWRSKAIHRFTAHAQHLHHIADVVRAAGWVSPEEAAAREAAAEQAGREDNALHDMCYVSGSKALEAREAAARREALLKAKTLAAGRYSAWLPSPGLSSDWVAGWHAANNDITTTLQVAIESLAEPERDEEGGR